jgi:membrane protease YdiL (CAAX protease family)
MTWHVSRRARRMLLWSGWVVIALTMFPVLDGPVFGVAVPASALVLALVPGTLPRSVRGGRRLDLFAVVVMYIAVVALLRTFVGFTTSNVFGLFMSFAGALLVGVVGPVVYTVWGCGGSLADLGLRLDNWRTAGVLPLVFAGVQFALTLWGYDLPTPVNWVPLLVMAMVVGVFESIFFRGFVQNRLEAHFGPVAGVAGAAVLYGMYHVGYGMDTSQLLFLTGLGVVYAVAFAIGRNVIVLWPLLTPLGSFYANVKTGDIEVPWASIAGFADVLAVMLVAIWLAHRRQHRRELPASPSGRTLARS